MCKFCDSLTDRNKEITWAMRSSMADDNVSDMIHDSENVISEMNKFGIYGYEIDGNVMVGIDYREEITTKGEITSEYTYITSPFSETIQFNFCPICGKQISKIVKDFEDYHAHQIRIDDKEET